MSKNKKKKPVKKAAPKKKVKVKSKVKPKKILKAAVKAKQEKSSKGKVASKPIKEEKVKVSKAELIIEIKEDVVLTNAEGKRYCKVHDCDEAAVIEGHCRLHYIMFWKRNKNKAKILDGNMLDKYIEELTQRYPDKYLEMLRKDLSSEKDFNGIIAEMDAEEAEDSDNEEDDNRFIEEVRGGVPGASDDDDGF